MPPFTAWSKTISPIGAGSGRFDAQRLPETTIVEKYRIRAGQEANVLSVNIAIHVEVEIGLAVAIVIESALGNQKRSEMPNLVMPPRSVGSSTRPPSSVSSFLAADAYRGE
jgi:hypothetical protein